MSIENKNPRVGVGVIIIKDKKVLLGKRKAAHGSGKWSWPGGHLEFGETWEDCAKREVAEEVGIKIKNTRFGTVTNDIFVAEGKHYITICIVADYESGEVRVLEPDKCEGWEWFAWNDIPKNLFLPLVNQLASGFRPKELS